MKNDNTIYALASAFGKAGVSVFRVSGENAVDVLKAMCGQKAYEDALKNPRKAVFGKVAHAKNGEHIDDCVVIYFKNPASFTGEDVIEFHSHGSRAVINAMLESFNSCDGVRLAEPGEFSRRAFENGKLDLTQVEGLADLIEAKTEAQRKQALRQMEGALSGIYNSWREIMVEILANIEACIDFAEDELPENVEERMEDRAQILLSEIKAHLNDNRKGEILREGLSVAIVGEPNVGKSSLFNKMIGADKAIISSVAGTTRDVVDAVLDVNGFPVELCDTAGIRETAEEIESEGIKRALKRAENADVKIYVITEDSVIDEKLIDENTILLVNKCDDGVNESYISGLNDNVFGKYGVSVKNGFGWDNFWNGFSELIAQKMDALDVPMLTKQRHRDALEQVVVYLDLAIKESQLDLKAENFRIASDYIGKILGKIDVEELLDKIFSGFCIGK